MYDARSHSQVPDGAQRRPAEKDETLAVVEIIALVRAIVVAAVEILPPLHKIYGQTAIIGHIDVRRGIGPWIAHRTVLVHQTHRVLTGGERSHDA